MFMFGLYMVCDNLGEATPCFFKNENRKKNYFFLHFILKEKSFEKNIFFYFTFIKILKKYLLSWFPVEIVLIWTLNCVGGGFG